MNMDLLEVGATLEKMQAVLSLAEEELEALREESKQCYHGALEQRLHNVQLSVMLVRDSLRNLDREVSQIDLAHTKLLSETKSGGQMIPTAN